eukprot:3690087-Pyramimonas_sp.AAC.1
MEAATSSGIFATGGLVAVVHADTKLNRRRQVAESRPSPQRSQIQPRTTSPFTSRRSISGKRRSGRRANNICR